MLSLISDKTFIFQSRYEEQLLCSIFLLYRQNHRLGWKIHQAELTQQGFSLASAIGHSLKIVPDVQEFAVQLGQFVRDDFLKHTLYGNAQ